MASSKKKVAQKTNMRNRQKGLSIGEFNLSHLNALSELDEIFPGIKLFAAVTMINILNMVQIRAALNTLPPALVDKSDSYKFYKARLNKKSPVQGLLISLGVCQIAPFLEADPGLLTNSIISYNDCGAGAGAKFIATPNKDNYEPYFHGVVSRMTGLVNSCPSTSPNVFNFPSGHLEFKVQDVIDALPFKEKPSAEEVKKEFREWAMGAESMVIFNETPLPLPNGKTPLENEIFGDSLKRVSRNSIALDRGSVVPENRMTEHELFSVLSPFEKLQYSKAMGSNPSKAREIAEIASARLSQLNSKKAGDVTGTAKNDPSDSGGSSSDPEAPAKQASSGPSNSESSDIEKKDSATEAATQVGVEVQTESQTVDPAGSTSAPQQASEPASSRLSSGETSGSSEENIEKKS